MTTLNAYKRNILLRLFFLFIFYNSMAPIGGRSYSLFCATCLGVCTYTVWSFCCVGYFGGIKYGSFL